MNRILTNHRRVPAAIGVLAALWLAMACTTAASAADYVPGQVLVGYARSSTPATAASVKRRLAARQLAPSTSNDSQVLQLPPSVSVSQAISQLRGTPGVAYAVPNYVAHAAGYWIPNDPGRAHRAGGWQALQWNFLPQTGVNAPPAWSNLFAERHPGASGVTIAVLDTGVAYRRWRQFRKSPDFSGTRFVAPYDFVAHNNYPLDRNGHGTLITGTIAESTNNRIGVTGLAYGAKIMPIRVLNGSGDGYPVTIARGIRYAVRHGAQVINLSLEFDPGVTSGEIPDIISAINFAHLHGVTVVGAAGNDESSTMVAYPARAPDVIAVGATTRDRCVAYYSNGGPRLDLVAPGGGEDASLPGDPNCHPGFNLPDIFQMTLLNPVHPGRFGFPGGWYGTSMAAAHVAAAVAMVIASGVIGRHPSPDDVRERLQETAAPLGGAQPNRIYGYGLVDVGAATAPAT